jgi:FkbH-like protein
MSDSGAPALVSQAGGKERWVAAKARWRHYLNDREQGSSGPNLRLGLAATFTANTLAQFVGAHLLDAGIRPQIDIGPYNQLFQVCLDPAAHFAADCDAIALLWRIEDLMGEEAAAYLGEEAGALERALEKLAALAEAVARLRASFARTIIVALPPLPTALSAGPLSLDNPVGLGSFHRSIAARLVALVSRIEGVHLVDFDAVQRHVGYAASFDARQWYLYRQPFSDAFLHQAGVQLGRILAATRRSPKKCIVLDCDNTLWGGVIGEDGLDGIEIGNEFPGSAYADFQKLLLRWRKQGVFLAILSKNNEADVWEVFDRHDGMVLKRTDISAARIDWEPKAENVAAIAKALNVGLDSLIFIDDSAMEIAYMREMQPDVSCILLPEDPADIVPALQDLFALDRLETTVEDRARVDMMRAEIDREAFGAKMTKDEFLRALGLRLELFAVGSEDLGRVTQLINKTNQFNLTTVRRTLDEVRALANSRDHRLYGLSVADKFGAYGLTGVVVVALAPDRATWIIDTLLLSCRVLGRGVEAALLAGLAADAQGDGARELVATFVPTKKNSLAATFLPDHGFTQDEDGRWRLPLAQAPSWPDFIERLRRPAADAVRAA